MELKLAETLAKRTIEQWEEHGQYRVMNDDKILFANGKEPDEIVIARALLEYCKKTATNG